MLVNMVITAIINLCALKKGLLKSCYLLLLKPCKNNNQSLPCGTNDTVLSASLCILSPCCAWPCIHVCHPDSTHFVARLLANESENSANLLLQQ